jgi:hypothetical protein
MMEKESNKKPPAFRFLRPREFAALTQAEKAKYLSQAIDAVRGGAPLDDMPDKGEQH